MDEQNTLMLLTDKQVNDTAKLLDDVVDFVKIIKNKALGAGAELLDGKAFKLAINGINNLVSPHVPDEFKDEFQIALDDILDNDKDFTVAADQFFAVANQLVDRLEDKGVKLYIIAGAKVIIEMIKTFILMNLENLAEKE
jgi:hypothetical protein